MTNYDDACIHCGTRLNSYDALETSGGDLCCDECAGSHCDCCLEGDCEIETWDGGYVCMHCHSGYIDNAHEHLKD